MVSSLYVKTNYCLLSSLVSIDTLIQYAQTHHLSQLAICDDQMTSTKIFYNACMNHGIKPVVGLDVKYGESDHILLYAKGYKGYQNLIQLSTILSKRSIEKEDLTLLCEDVVAVLPFECFSCDDELSTLYENYYIGVLNREEEIAAKASQRSVVFLNRVLYLDKSLAPYLKYLWMIRDGKTIQDSIEFEDHYNYPLSLKEVQNLVSKEAIDNIDSILELCCLEIPKLPDLLPIYDENLNGDEYLWSLSKKGLSKRLGGSIPPVYHKRLEYELSVIKNMGFSNYFLVVYDFIKYAKKNGILVGPGRGSAAGSLTAYCLGITEIDPIRYNLLFERFLNPERVTMPDIDTDFPDIYRADVIEYVKKKYGEKKVSGIITFGTLSARLVLRDVGRVLTIPSYSIDKLCKRIPPVTKMKLSSFYQTDDAFRNMIQNSDQMMLLYKISSLIEGFPRHISTHAAGIVMSRKPLDQIIPLVRGEDMYMSGYTMEYLEELGLLKMDFLGIKNLTTIMNILRDIKHYEEIEVSFNQIPLDDPEALKIFEYADTCGIFQFESAGMKNFLRKLRPNSIEDIFAAIALFRPGPAINIDSYIRRKHQQEKIEYLAPTLEQVLAPTYGIIIYQEQIMQIANIMAGYSLGEADILRRAMSKKKMKLLESEETKFIEGSIKRGYPKEKAKEIFTLILNFANYGFNKSHSVSYAIVAYKMAYLKAKYPKYFFRNLLTSVIGNESKTLEYIQEAQKLGIRILPPNIHTSTHRYEVQKEGILFPLSSIKNVGIMTCRDIMSMREGPFIDIYDCFSKILSRNVNKSTLESLIDASCFSSFGYNKKTLYYNLDNLINYASLTKDLDPEIVIKPEIEIKEEFSKVELLIREKECFGFYLSDHPTTMYFNRHENIVKLMDIKDYFNKTIRLVVLIDKIRIVLTKKGDKMAFFLVSDATSQMDVTLFPKVYDKYKEIEKSSIVLLTGVVQKRFDQYQVIVNQLEVLQN